MGFVALTTGTFVLFWLAESVATGKFAFIYGIILHVYGYTSQLVYSTSCCVSLQKQWEKANFDTPHLGNYLIDFAET